MITIDGSQGEGGGQILRTALALSMVTGQRFRLMNIRAGRARPGLMRQHLTCVNAAAAICGAEVTGAGVGSREITFAPGAVRAGEYHFAIGTAGGTMLVLQAVLPALLGAGGASTVAVEGGTHNGGAPIFEFFEQVLVPILGRAGVVVRCRLERHGFYPAGGGRVVVEVEPTQRPRAVEVLERGERISMRATAVVSQLSPEIALRELKVLGRRLTLEGEGLQVRQVEKPRGPGNVVWVEMEYEGVREVFSAVGEVGRSAESVADGLAEEVRAYIAGRRPVGRYLADQLMVPFAVLGGGRYATGPLTDHARTNLETLAMFGVRAGWEEERGCVEVEKIAR